MEILHDAKNSYVVVSFVNKFSLLQYTAEALMATTTSTDVICYTLD